MEYLYLIFPVPVLFNVLMFIFSLLIPSTKENRIAYFSLYGTAWITFLILCCSLMWIYLGFPEFSIHLFNLYTWNDYEFSVEFMINEISVVFLLVGNIITLLIVYFSRYYMIREKGHKRFFNTILFFYLAYNVTVLSGNFITLFIGWEFLGISSFLLIAFYRERYLPVRNAVRVFSLYRFGDVGFIMALWVFNQWVHHDYNFFILNSKGFYSTFIATHPYRAMAVSLLLLSAALVKSAQFPFNYWVARAMEGPTPSSAIFYGSLSIHMGLLLMLKTHTLWESEILIRIILLLFGLITILTANPCALVQASVKAQIAYSSVTQIGWMFIELSLGFKSIVLIHFAGNAFLRTYQLLISPSVAAYEMRRQMYFSRYIKYHNTFLEFFPIKIRNTIYLWALKEWNLDYFVSRYVFGTFKNMGKKLKFLNFKSLLLYVSPMYILGLFFYYHKDDFSVARFHYLPILFSLISFLLILRSYAERDDVILILFLILFSQFFILLAISFNEAYPLTAMVMYLSGIISGFIICRYIIHLLSRKEKGFLTLNKYYGHIYQYPKHGLLFFIGVLCMIGFPITPTFIAEDIILEHIHLHQYTLAFFTAMSYIFCGITGIRMYARIFLGPHFKQYHEVALKSG